MPWPNRMRRVSAAALGESQRSLAGEIEIYQSELRRLANDGVEVERAMREVEADNGRCLHYGVLEFKSSDRSADVPSSVEALPLRPVKLSKFLWATKS